MVPGFQMKIFLQLLEPRAHIIDEQILDLLTSFTDFLAFKTLVLDFKKFYQEQERLRILTIKSTKKDPSTKVKKKDNIFQNNNFQLPGDNSLSSLKNSVKKPKPDMMVE